MVSGGVNKCMKYSLMVFNLAFVIIGIALVYLGVSALNSGTRFLAIVETGSFSAPPKLFIAIGAIMFLIAFLGCCGAWMENHAMIMAYSVLVGLILILQLGVGIAVFLMQDDVEEFARTGLTKTLKEYHNTNNTDSKDIRRSWDLLQTELKCCGVNNYTNWADSYVNPLPVNDTLVPDSCCIGGGHVGCADFLNMDNIKTLPIADVKGKIYTEGCLSRAVDELGNENMGYFGIGIAVVELIGVLFACLLARSIRFSYETV